MTLVDPDPTVRNNVQVGLAIQSDAIHWAGLSQTGGRSVRVLAEVGATLSTAAIVLECGPEDLNAKQEIFRGLLAKTPPETILATASSAIVMSQILPDTVDQARCLVVHPVNPPAVLRVIEQVPAPGTACKTTARSADQTASA